jgi:hypothetical protein
VSKPSQSNGLTREAPGLFGGYLQKGFGWYIHTVLYWLLTCSLLIFSFPRTLFQFRENHIRLRGVFNPQLNVSSDEHLRRQITQLFSLIGDTKYKVMMFVPETAMHYQTEVPVATVALIRPWSPYCLTTICPHHDFVCAASEIRHVETWLCVFE